MYEGHHEPAMVTQSVQYNPKSNKLPASSQLELFAMFNDLSLTGGQS